MKLNDLFELKTEEDKIRVYEIFNTCKSLKELCLKYDFKYQQNILKKLKHIASIVNFDISLYEKKSKKQKYANCLYCGKELNKNQTKFCSSSCSASYNNKLRPPMSSETKQKIREALSKDKVKIDKQFKTCKYCGKLFESSAYINYCCKECSDNYKQGYFDIKVKKDTKLQGDISEIEVKLFLLKKGYTVFIPHGDRCRYDLLMNCTPYDSNNTDMVLRIQVKSPCISNGCLDVNCKSTAVIRGRCIAKKYTDSEIDLIAVPYKNKCYIVPIYEIHGNNILLRFDKTKNNNNININWANDFLFENKINDIINFKKYKINQVDDL